MLLPHNPEVTSNKVGGPEARNHTNCHRKCEVFYGLDTVHYRKHIDDYNADNGGEGGTDGTGHGLGDTEVNQLIICHFSSNTSVFLNFFLCSIVP